MPKKSPISDLYRLSVEEIKKGGWHRARIHCSKQYRILYESYSNVEYIIDRAEWDCGYYDDSDDKLLDLLWMAARISDISRSARLGRDKAEFLLFVAEVQDKERIIQAKFKRSWKRLVAFAEAFLETNEADLMEYEKRCQQLQVR